jgi:hypothetical protein
MNRLFLGFLVAGTALGGSAFKNVESHTTPINGKALASGYFVQSATNSYTYVSTTTGDAGQCAPANPNPCAYIVPEGNSIPGTGPYSKEQLSSNFGLSPRDQELARWVPEPEQ